MTDAASALSALRRHGWTMAVAESLTGGAVCAEVVAVPGASTTFLGGVVAYAAPVKHSLLGVDPVLLAEHGAVHPEVARQMAAGVRRAVSVEGKHADVGLATTGIAGPESPDGQPVGTVHIAVVTPDGTRVDTFRFDGDRDEIRERSVGAALGVLREMLGE